MIIIAINCFVIIVNYRNRFDKALTEILQFRMALILTTSFFLLHHRLQEG